jgi:hypothetical protein
LDAAFASECRRFDIFDIIAEFCVKFGRSFLAPVKVLTAISHLLARFVSDAIRLHNNFE